MGGNADGWCPLHIAVMHSSRNDAELVNALLHVGAEPNALTTCSQEASALHLAVSHASVEAVSALIMGKADLESKDGEDITPLFLAAGRGDADVLQCLLDANASLEA